ncbi:hypothetical protein NSS82_10195 [Paenibacillus sp. FSL H7-0735]|uniref:hypothetical protein n=1 Tax=Paenibacillus sp. FSL H7-0735 TaxID=2954736 RepID=UPI0030F5DF9F
MVYSGLLEPEHYKKIGSALWLFAWCISSTTAETEDDGIVWGIVLGGKPMKLSEIGGKFGVNDKTVSRWISDLQDHGYIHITRAPRGLIVKVRNSKKNLLKRSDKNVRSQESEQTKMSDHNESEQTKMSDHGADSGSDRTKMSDAKDIKDLITTTTILENEFSDEITEDPDKDGIITLLNAYCSLHRKIDFHVTQTERLAMGKMVAGGMPVPFTITTMESLYRAKQEREGVHFQQPNSFSYYLPGIKEAWRNANAVQQPTHKKTTVQNSKRDKLADLRRRAEEAKRLEASTSH